MKKNLTAESAFHTRHKKPVSVYLVEFQGGFFSSEPSKKIKQMKKLLASYNVWVDHNFKTPKTSFVCYIGIEKLFTKKAERRRSHAVKARE